MRHCFGEALKCSNVLKKSLSLSLPLFWVVLTYFIAAFLGADTYTIFLITGLTLVWAGVCFRLWQINLSRNIWPLFLGSLVMCWWPYLDWYAIKDIVVPASGGEAIIVTKPWYASWTFKFILSMIPVALGYSFKWKQAKKRHSAAPRA